MCSTSLAQIEIQVPKFQTDSILRYDIFFEPTTDTPRESALIDQYDKNKVKDQIEELNKRTPIDLVYNKYVDQQIRFYLFQRPKQVARLLALSEYYFPIFEEYLDKNQLPLELKYLAIIESSLNPTARSYAGAVGLWQFMYATAKEHGLRVNTYLDERKDVYKSTQAACDYLKKAHRAFNNWDLAMASYNAGRRNVTKSMRRSGGKLNYWEVRPFLPKETRNYIPAFIAAVYVMNFANDYGILPDTNALFDTHQVDSVYLKKPVKIDHLAKLLNIDSVFLTQLNPTYRQKLIPKTKNERFPIILPNNKSGEFLSNEDSIYVVLEKMELAEKLNYPSFSDIEKIRYTVKSGDYLGRIAKKYNCKTKDIMLWNDLKSHKIKTGQKLNIYRTVK